jgi:site-specific recombinase XerD
VLNGVDLATLAELLGHKDLKMIAEHYGHLEQQPEHLLNAVAKVVRRA